MTKQLFDDRCLGSTTYKSYSNLRVDSDPNLVRNTDSQAIINTNSNEFDQFIEASRKKYNEKKNGRGSTNARITIGSYFKCLVYY